MAAGPLHHVLSLERKASVPDGNGLRDEFQQIDHGQVRADVQSLGTAAYLDGMQVGERITHRIRIRWRQAQDFDHLSWGSQRLRVKRIGDRDGDRRWLIIEAEELTPEVLF